MTTVPVFTFLAMVAVPVFSLWQENPDKCGRRYETVSSAIVGGNKSEEFAWPWQVFVVYDLGDGMVQLCGGSLIDPQWVITAAHCVSGHLCNTEKYTLLTGSVNFSATTDNVQVRQPSDIYIHAEYDDVTLQNDIALFKISGENPFIVHEDYKINTVCLPTMDIGDEFEVGQTATVTGWGENPDDVGSTLLYEVDVPIVSQAACQMFYPYGTITDGMICAGSNETKIDACKGDSGGPLVTFSENDNEQYYLAGVVSFGIDCQDKIKVPGVYTRVSYYENWIRSVFNCPECYSSVSTCSTSMTSETLSGGAIAAIILGLVLLIVIIAITVFIVYMLRNRDSEGLLVDT